VNQNQKGLILIHTVKGIDSHSRGRLLVMVSVPAQYESLLEAAAQATGIPESVVDAQVNDESGFNAQATSPTGAEGLFQFEPGTYNNVAQQAGVQPGTEYNPADEEKAYVVYMNQLLQEEGGSLDKALEAYNAGPGDLAAGAGYASSILSAANEPVTTTAGSGSGSAAQDDSALGDAVNIFGVLVNPLGNIENLFGSAAGTSAEGEAAGAAESVIGDVVGAQWQAFMNITGISGVKDFMVRAGLILLGLIILIIGLVKLFDVHPVQNTVSIGKKAANDAVGAAIL
jgi:hypothetical protein